MERHLQSDVLPRGNVTKEGQLVRRRRAATAGGTCQARASDENLVVRLGEALIIDDLRKVALEAPGASAAAVYDRPIGLRLLYEDPEAGEEHYLIRYPAGVKGRVHQHSAAHTIVVLEGNLDANDRVIGPGSYAHFPADQPMRHQSGGDEGCLFVIMFHGPFDVQLLDDAHHL